MCGGTSRVCHKATEGNGSPVERRKAGGATSVTLRASLSPARSMERYADRCIGVYRTAASMRPRRRTQRFRGRINGAEGAAAVVAAGAGSSAAIADRPYITRLGS